MHQKSVKITGISNFGREWTRKMGNPWNVRKVTDHVLFSTQTGPWMLIERDHFQRWVNLRADQNFLIQSSH
ncbi:hypothetical protein Ga0123461_0767 [Mariprofundus aestuarium]|uniref:Uncharacterized protein n=1 Tax=Mariprofundus aestuarium TaxID=1921086 RepID=A0A2K8L061_MARES|nr:hypothetical protein [Mariprofundus aestuarium]ATX79191.1 hypothetical protein Ga0123461_0767 [Mariprofundus aestuarium]